MYKINEGILKNVVNDVFYEIRENEKTLEKIIQIDEEVCGFKTDLKQIMRVFEEYKFEQIQDEFEENVIIHHYGNPYITVMICMHSLLRQSEVIISIDDKCYGINQAIINMLNDSLKEYKIKCTFRLENNISKEKVKELNPSKLICLGNQNGYQYFRDISDLKVEIVPLYDLNVYYDSVEYYDLAHTIVDYAEANLYEIEIYH